MHIMYMDPFLTLVASLRVLETFRFALASIAVSRTLMSNLDLGDMASALRNGSTSRFFKIDNKQHTEQFLLHEFFLGNQLSTVFRYIHLGWVKL